MSLNGGGSTRAFDNHVPGANGYLSPRSHSYNNNV